MVLVISGVVILPTSVSVAVTVGVVIAYVVEPELVGEVSACVTVSEAVVIGVIVSAAVATSVSAAVEILEALVVFVGVVDVEVLVLESCAVSEVAGLDVEDVDEDCVSASVAFVVVSAVVLGG